MKAIKSIIHKKVVTKNIFLFISILFYSLLFLPFISSIPFLDGNIQFVHISLFHEGGFEKYFTREISIHPPFKILLLHFLFNIFNEPSLTLNLTSYFIGTIGIISIYYFTLKLSNKLAASLSSLLLAINPLFISVGLFGLTDFILTSFLLFSLWMYLTKRYILFSISLGIVVLTKETGLLIVSAFALADYLFFLKNKKLYTYLYYLFPFSLYASWTFFLTLNNKGAWKDWIFTDTADKGTFYTIMNNLFTLRIFNEYAAQHFLQLLFLNFNWIVIGLSFLLSIFILKEKGKRTNFLKTIKRFDEKSKVIIFSILFCFSYSITVLTLQTYTIPRYSLPLIPFFIMWFSVALAYTKNYLLKIMVISIVFLFTIAGLFFSIDPIAKSLWGEINILGQNVYATNYHLSGNDGITYNFQYLLMLKKRTDILHGKPFSIVDCPHLFPDPQNDYVTLGKFNLLTGKAIKACRILPSQ